jgi:hypothetical protein
VSFVFELLVAVGGVAVGRWLVQRLRTSRATDRPATDGAPEVPAPLDAFPCRLGDVVVRKLERDEAWLAGALVFEDERPWAILFIAPESGADRALLAHAADDGLTWLSPLSSGELFMPGEPPLALEYAGARFERFRRLPVRVRTLGSHTPTVGDKAVVAEYKGPGTDRIVAVIGADQTRVWRGTALRRWDFEVLPGGQDDASEGKAR